MSKIVLFLPGNIFHSNITQKKMKHMLDEQAGMATLRSSKVPLVFAWQKIDKDLAPDIYDPGPHEICAGSYTHALHSLLSHEDSTWQTAQGINHKRMEKKQANMIDITFYPEFAPPVSPDLIQTGYFFLLAPETRFYDFSFPTGDFTVRNDLSPVRAIRFGSKIGILLDQNGASPIRKQWHAYQENPAKGLDLLVAATEKVSEQAAPLHLAVWDLEAPYVGSDATAKQLWLDYFEALDKKGLIDAFSPLASHLQWFSDHAVDVEQLGGPPHRLLTKWSIHDSQLTYIRRVYHNIPPAMFNTLNRPERERARKLLAIARGSDNLSVMDSLIRKQEPDTSRYIKKTRGEILKLGLACLNILEDILAGRDYSLEMLSKADPLLGPRLVKILQ